jgi:hypothetical protein
MGLTATSKGTDFELAPVGVHPSRCYRVIDLGTQKSSYKGVAKMQHKVLLSFELLGDQRMKDGKPYMISVRYTMSTSEKSQLRHDLESWRGAQFTEAEIAAFEVSKVLDKYCLLNVIHEKNGERTYANVSAIMPLPRNMPKPEAVNEAILFDLDKRDMRIFETFGDSLKATIMASAEWDKTAHPTHEMPDDIPWEANPPPSSVDDFDSYKPPF